MPTVGGSWDTPVKVVGRDGEKVKIARVGRALEMLLHEWPTVGPCFQKARQRALEAYSHPADEAAQTRAQEAFIAAAKEAGILVE